MQLAQQPCHALLSAQQLRLQLRAAQLQVLAQPIQAQLHLISGAASDVRGGPVHSVCGGSLLLQRLQRHQRGAGRPEDSQGAGHS